MNGHHPHHLDELLPRADDSEPQPAPVEYDKHLPSWRATVRSVLVRNVERESEVIARIQHSIRTPLLDAYFTWSSQVNFFCQLRVLIWPFKECSGQIRSSSCRSRCSFSSDMMLLEEGRMNREPRNEFH